MMSGDGRWLSMKSSRQGRKKPEVKIKCEFGSHKPPVPDLIPLNNAGIRKNGGPSKSGKVSRAIKSEGRTGCGSSPLPFCANDSNNNSKRGSVWETRVPSELTTKPALTSGGEEDVYNFDEDDSLDGVKRNVIAKGKNVKRRISVKSVAAASSSSSGQVVAKPAAATNQCQAKYSPLKLLKSEIKQEALDDGGDRGAIEKHTPPLYQSPSSSLVKPTGGGEESVVEKKVECRKSSRRRPSVLYIEDPFEIILDSDELEGFDFDNQTLFLDRRQESSKRGRRKRGRGRHQKAVAPKAPQPCIDITNDAQKEQVVKEDVTQPPARNEEEEPEAVEIPEEPSVEEPVVEYRICPIDRGSPPRQPSSPPPRVNPIFLWVRQEDTRIVDVRCEDYDKRNRIRLTKTANGSWRAIPRTEINVQQAQPLPNRRHHGKEKKSKKKKRHRRHRNKRLDRQRGEGVKVEASHVNPQMPTCKVSLVPLPELLVQKSAHKVESQRNTSEEEGVEELTSDEETQDTQLQFNRHGSPNRAADTKPTTSLNDKNNNSVKIKHVRFALANNELKERAVQSAITESWTRQSGRKKNTGAVTRPAIKLEAGTRSRKDSSPAGNNNSRRQPPERDAPSTVRSSSAYKECTSPLHNSCSSQRSPEYLGTAEGDKEHCLLESSSDDNSSGSSDEVELSTGKVTRAPDAPKDRDETVRRQRRGEIEHGMLWRAATASPALVVTTTRAAAATQEKQLPVRNNNSKQSGSNNQCSESASVVIGKAQQTRKRPKEEEPSAQGGRIFASDDNNIGSGRRGGSHLKLATVRCEPEEVHLISEGEEDDEVQETHQSAINTGRRGSAENSLLKIAENQSTGFCAATKNLPLEDGPGGDDKPVRRGEAVEVAPVPSGHRGTVSCEEEEEEEDDDVAFLCSENANPNHLAEDGDSNNNSCVALVGDSGGDALSQQYSAHQTRLLTPEEQLHESLKATTELIAGIGGFVAAVTAADEDDLSLVEGARALGRCPMTGVELLDSLVVERSCEDSSSLSLANHRLQIKMPLTVTANTTQTTTSTVHTMCSGGGHGAEDYNDDDELLLDTVAPVADIISRLSDSPKCLSFNEAGEIEAISANAALFEKHTMDSMDALTMSIKELAEKNLKELTKAANSASGNSTTSSNPVNIRAFVTPDSCEDDFPRDLTCKAGENTSLSAAANKTTILSPLPRPISRGSDAIQSPQPSGLPAVPPSPDIFLNSNNRSKSLFLESILSSPSPPKMHHNLQQQPRPGSSDNNPGEARRKHQQKEPLDLGTCRKSASPTVTCSEEVSKRHHDQIVDLVSELESSSASSSTSGGSSRKRIKFESNLMHNNPDCAEKRSKMDSSMDLKHSKGGRGEDGLAHGSAESREPKGSAKCTATSVGHLMDILNSNAKDPDPLTQLRLLISNTEWKVPETLLVPKDRLNAVLASPAREIPLLLTTRPELRLPGAFAFPSILQDPDILVVSLAQLEAILEKQHELLKMKSSDKSSGATSSAKSHTDPRPNNSNNNKPNQCISTEKPQQAAMEKQQEDMMHQQIQRSINNKAAPSKAQQMQQQHQPPPGLLNNGLAGDIDAATIAAFNQMLWLPYINQMRGQITPDLLKAIAGLNEMLPLIAAQGRLQQGLLAAQNSNENAGNAGHNTPGSMAALNNSLEFAMWQEAMLHANQANLQRILKGNEARQSSSVSAATNAIELARKQLEHQQQQRAKVGMPPHSTSANHPRMGKQQQSGHSQQMPTTPLSPLTIPPFVAPPVVQNSPRYFNPMMAAAAAAAAAGTGMNQQSQNRNAMPNQMNTLHSPFSPNYNLRQPSHGQHSQKMHGSSQRSSTGGGGLLSPTNQGKKGSMMMPPNPFLAFGGQAANAMDFDDQMNVLATRKAQKDFEQALQMQQQRMQQQQQQQMQAKLAQDQKPMKMNMFSPPPTPASFLDPAKMAMHQHSQQQMFNQQMMSQLNELSKLSSLMTMPSAFDSPLSSNPLLAAQVAAAVNQQVGGHDHSHSQGSGGGHGGGPKLKVKPGMHLLDPLAMQRRLLNNASTGSSDEMSADMVSTTTSQSGLDADSSPDLNSPLWHPLFGNSSGQKGAHGGGGTYTSPWQWTTVTAAGE